MALDPALAQQWWDERYEKQLEQFARKNAYLHEFKDPEDLFQDMVIGVWMKAVDLFDPSRVSYLNLDPESPDYAKNLRQAFNAVFTTTLNGFLANLATHRGTGKSKWEKSVKSLESPLGGSGGEDGGATLLDVISDAEKDPNMMGDLSRMLRGVSKELRSPLGFIIHNLERGGSTGIWDQLRDRFVDPVTGKGWTKTRFINSLYADPVFMEWATNI